MTDKVIFAEKGDSIRCVAGHKLLEFTRDVYVNDEQNETDYKSTHPGIPEPVAGEPIPGQCPECGKGVLWGLSS